MTKGRVPLALVAIATIASVGFGAGVAWRDATRPAELAAHGPVVVPTTAAPASAMGQVVPSPAPGRTQTAFSPSASPPPANAPVETAPPPANAPVETAPPPAINPAAFVAPPLLAPLRQLDPRLRHVAPASPAWLYQSSAAPPIVIAPPGTPVTDWRLTSPDQHAVRGYAGDVSVAPGGAIDFHLAGNDHTARIDIFRMGLRDAHHVGTVRNVAIAAHADGRPDPSTGRIEDQWPVSYTLYVASHWRSGVYLAKLTGDSGGQSYVIFVVRSPRPTALTVVLPMLTYQAYNHEGGADLYGWDGGPHARAYEVSFDRPYEHQFGAGQFFWLDFPLIVWLEDHGYDPGYVTDLDLARNPQLMGGIDTLVFPGHSEYWTGGLRDIIGSRANRGTNLLFFGANDAYWQIRLAPDRTGTPDRTIVCYKDANLDPIARQDPSGATVGFSEPGVGRPPSSLMGTEYAGIVRGLGPLEVGPAITLFAPDLGLRPGDRLAGLIGGEVDGPAEPFTGLLLGSTPVAVGSDGTPATAGAALWVNPSGGRTFDAGTFGWAWGLDTRYAAGAPHFRAGAFEELTARILAWAGTQPDPHVVALLGARDRVEVTVGDFAHAVAAIGQAERLASRGQKSFVVEEEKLGSHDRFEVEREYRTRALATAEVRRLKAAHLQGLLEIDRGTSR